MKQNKGLYFGLVPQQTTERDIYTGLKNAGYCSVDRVVLTPDFILEVSHVFVYFNQPPELVKAVYCPIGKQWVKLTPEWVCMPISIKPKQQNNEILYICENK